jgi:hypothetical protein
MKKLKTEIKIDITKIEVSEGYYHIAYTYYIDGKKKTGKYHSDYDSWTIAEWKKVLEDGEAVKRVLEIIAGL